MRDPRFKTRVLAVILCAAALMAAAGAYALALRAVDRPTVRLGLEGEPEDTTALFFNAVCLREWDAAARYVLGEPDLSLGASPRDELARTVWLAYQQSWSWSMGEGGMIDSLNAWQTVSFSALRPELLFDGMSEEVQEILARRVEETDDLDTVYDDQGQFLPAVIQSALQEATRARLAEPERYTAPAEVTLHLSFRDDRWQILPEEALWELLSGGGGDV